jgi:hypothetical protein
MFYIWIEPQQRNEAHTIAGCSLGSVGREHVAGAGAEAHVFVGGLIPRLKSGDYPKPSGCAKNRHRLPNPVIAPPGLRRRHGPAL